MEKAIYFSFISYSTFTFHHYLVLLYFFKYCKYQLINNQHIN